jgi:hypothetical protein
MRPLLFLVLTGLIAGCTSTPSGPVTEEGSLASGDGTLPTGEFRDTYDVTVNEGQWLRVTLQSDEFDPYLIVTVPGGEQSDLDDSTPGDTTSVTMVLRAPSAGTFNIIATSFRPGASGAYTLTYEVSDTEPAGGATDTAADAPADDAMEDDAMADEPAADDTSAAGTATDDGAAPAADPPKTDDATMDA